MKKFYLFITALLVAAAPKAMAITVDDLVGEYKTVTEGKTKLTAGGIQGVESSFDTYTMTIKKVDDKTITFTNFANCNVDMTATVDLETMTFSITDKQFPIGGIGFAFRPYTMEGSTVTPVEDALVTGSFNASASEITINEWAVFYGAEGSRTAYAYGKSTLTPQTAGDAPLKTFTATYDNGTWTTAQSGSCYIDVFDDHYVLRDYVKEGKEIKFTYNAETKKISMKDAVYTWGSPSYVNPGTGAWYLSFVVENDAIAFSPDFKNSSFDIGEEGGTMVICSDYYQNSNDLKPVAVYTATIKWGDGGPSTGITSVESTDNADAPVYNLSGMKVKPVSGGLYIRNGKKYIAK